MEHPYEIVRYKKDTNKGFIFVKFGCTLNRHEYNIEKYGFPMYD